MATNHYDKWIIKSLAGTALLFLGILFIYYTLAQLQNNNRWVLYGIAASIIICSGVLLLCSAFVHKLKFDIRHRQKSHDKSSLES